MPMKLESINDIQDLIVTVMGLGRYKQGSGIGAAKWLLRHGAQLVITDLKGEKELKSSVDLVTEWYQNYRKEYPDREIYAPVFILGQHREDDFTNVQMVVKNPDVPTESDYIRLAKEHDVLVESDVSLFFHFFPHPVHTVTGTRGKSTTTALFAEMLKQKHEKAIAAGNIMHSPLEELDWLLKESEPVPVALELSSWLLESLQHLPKGKGPEIAIFTNVSKDHLDRYESFEAYIEAKATMFKLQTEEQFSVANLDDEVVKQVAEAAPSKTYWFSTKPLPDGVEGSFLDAEGNLMIRMNSEERKICHASKWPALQGEHNQQNALAAACGASIAGVSDEGICKALQTFAGLEGRQQTVREWNKITFINDTTATSADATIAALDRFASDGGAKRIVLIVGGKAKGFTYEALAEKIKATCKHVVYLEGSHTNQIEEIVGPEIGHDHAKNMKEAVKAAAAAAGEGDVVLLSPGGSSFDLFENEYDRGGQFVEEVKNLKAEEGRE